MFTNTPVRRAWRTVLENFANVFANRCLRNFANVFANRNSEMLGMKVFFFPVDIVLLGIGGGYEGTLLSRGDLDLFCFVGFACFQGATPLTQMNTHVRQQ